MKDIDNALKSTQWMQNAHRWSGLSSQISRMLKNYDMMTRDASGLGSNLVKNLQFQEGTLKNLSGLSMFAGLAKGLHVPLGFDSVKSKNIALSFGIPQTTLDAIRSLDRHHEQLFGQLRAMAGTLKIQSPAITQIKNLNYAATGISVQIAALGAYQKKWTIIEDFERVTERALEFTETLTEEVTEEQRRQFQVLLSLIFVFFKKNKSLGVSALLIIDIFLRFADIHQYYDFLTKKPEQATKFDINRLSTKQDSILHFINLVSEQFKQVDEYRITNRSCKIKLKPKSKALTLAHLPEDIEVIVVQIHHKWVYVSFFDPIDNLPQTGWIKKKYLDKPKRK